MGTPDLRGTQGTFTFYTDDPGVTPGSVPGGLIVRTEVVAGHAGLRSKGRQTHCAGIMHMHR